MASSTRPVAVVAVAASPLAAAISDRLRSTGMLVLPSPPDDGPVHVLVCAAPDIVQPTVSMDFAGADPTQWLSAVIDSLTTLFVDIRRTVPSMRRAGGARLIVLGAGWAASEMPHATASATVHGGVVAMMKTLARELGKDGISVNEVVLDPTAPTPSSVADVAATVAYLAGPGAASVVGQMLTLGGGGMLRP